MKTVSFAEGDIFWPPADELTEVAQRIRKRLGEWPQAGSAWRICLIAPEQPQAGDLIVLSEGRGGESDCTGQWLLRGAGVIDVVSRGVTLRLGQSRYALEGVDALAEDWLAALAGFLDCGFDPHDALVLAMAWRDGDEASADDAWPVDLSRFPRVVGLRSAPAPAFAPCPHRLGLYPVLPSADWVERALEAGVNTAQLRLKRAESDFLAAEITRCVEAGQRRGARVFINDHWREAVAAGAYGVHLGQEDIHTADLGAIAAAGLRLGLSTHGYYEMLSALHFKPSYIALGAVFPTTTKVMPTAPQGLARLARYVRLLDSVVPLVAIGGIDGAVLADVLATGVGSAAVVRAVTEAANPGTAMVELRRKFA
jgi:thiamine-phosphate pyrophosphorylase